MSATAFIDARDFLLAHREEYERAYRDFHWPVLDRFNWALDYFDPMAQGNDRPGLWIVDEGGGETKLSFAELAERSNRVANHLRALGVRRGDRLLMMLGNVTPLWECMLAAMKLGAVISLAQPGEEMLRWMSPGLAPSQYIAQPSELSGRAADDVPEVK